jgi:hypothetical protein
MGDLRWEVKKACLDLALSCVEDKRGAYLGISQNVEKSEHFVDGIDLNVEMRSISCARATD